MQEYDSDRSPSRVVVETVADVAGVDPLELEPPLGEVVDPDALDALFGGSRRSEGRVTFDYAGYRVEVWSDGSVVVDDREST